MVVKTADSLIDLLKAISLRLLAPNVERQSSLREDLDLKKIIIKVLAHLVQLGLLKALLFTNQNTALLIMYSFQ